MIMIIIIIFSSPYLTGHTDKAHRPQGETCLNTDDEWMERKTKCPLRIGEDYTQSSSKTKFLLSR